MARFRRKRRTGAPIIYGAPPQRAWAREGIGRKTRYIRFRRGTLTGNDYNGAEHRYTLHFDKGKFPPVKGFWSLTMYDELASWCQPAESLHSQPTRSICHQPGRLGGPVSSGRLTRQSEGGQLASSAKREYSRMLRLYWPTDTPPSIIDGTWKPPAISEVK